MPRQIINDKLGFETDRDYMLENLQRVSRPVHCHFGVVNGMVDHTSFLVGRHGLPLHNIF